MFNWKNLNFNPIFLENPEPDFNDTMSDFAKRYLPQIKSEKPIIIGVGLGGMLAVEIGKMIDTEKIFIISTAKSYRELSYFHYIMCYLHNWGLLSKKYFKKPTKILTWLFNIKPGKETEMYAEILKNNSDNLLNWLFHYIPKWRNDTIPKNLIHIHGEKDRFIPVKKDCPYYIIKNAGHFAVWSKPKQVEGIIAIEMGRVTS